ncbi:MAG: hypothetical protein HPY53_12515 [Brevinematales bacterium]|nr:hypothetical protein [Brevinematales bacterium]
MELLYFPARTLWREWFDQRHDSAPGMKQPVSALFYFFFSLVTCNLSLIYCPLSLNKTRLGNII